MLSREQNTCILNGFSGPTARAAKVRTAREVYDGRQQPGRPKLTSLDRLLWVWLYRVWPRCLKVMVLVKSATVVQWHRAGFRLYWRWRSRAGRPRAARAVRDLIRQMSKANPLWGAPRVHGEILKLGIDVSQATVAKYMVRRVGRPSPTWRSFLRNQAVGIAAIDMFVVVSSFQLLYVMIILAHDRRRIVRFDVTEHPTASWLSQQVTPLQRESRSTLVPTRTPT